MRNWIIMGVSAVALAGCIPPGRGPQGPQAPGGPVPIEGDSITYETSPCFGACPVYSVTVRPDGSGIFNGKRFTAVSGARAFTLSAAQYEAFARRLAPYRPQSGSVRYAIGEANCGNPVSDMPSVDVMWTRAIGDSQQLHYYFGCDRQATQAMRDALGGAVETLPIQELIGARP